jgi:hypothetical protein
VPLDKSAEALTSRAAADRITRNVIRKKIQGIAAAAAKAKIVAIVSVVISSKAIMSTLLNRNQENAHHKPTNIYL